jgi:hypothetical protein
MKAYINLNYDYSKYKGGYSYELTECGFKHSYFVFGKFQVQMSVRLLTTMTDTFRCVSQSLQANAEIVSKFGPDSFLPYPLKIIIY